MYAKKQFYPNKNVNRRMHYAHVDMDRETNTWTGFI